MSDKREQWRPTLPPKSKSVNAGFGKSSTSEVVRGAAQHAFGDRPNTPSNTSLPAKPPSSGARSAAVAAGNARASAISSSLRQDATNTTSACVTTYSKGQPPAGAGLQSSDAGPPTGPALEYAVQRNARPAASPEKPAQRAARMASRSPARRTEYGPSLQDKVPMPHDQSALAAGKIASTRLMRNPSEKPSSQSQTSIRQVEQSPISLGQIPSLPRKPAEKPKPDPLARKLAGAAAAQAAVRHAQPHVLSLSPMMEAPKKNFLFARTESLSPDKSALGSSLEGTSTRSTLASPTEIDKVSVWGNAHSSTARNQLRAAPLPAISTSTRSSRPTAISDDADIIDHRTGPSERLIADAIVAGSLASSRAQSPIKVETSLTASQRSRSVSHSSLPLLPHNFLPHDKMLDLPTKTSHAPPRSLKLTLREPSKHKDYEEEEMTRRGRKHFMRKHPHKHHEGDRKRWRDKVTERERRRYEGVWAANRGLFTFGDADPASGEGKQRTPEHDLVVNVVVRDVWERSRLPKDVLEEIWDLVASSEEVQALQRDQFVVGLWLIDQRLKGRKLPVRVSSDVWNSVRHTHGMKISKNLY